MAALRDRPLLTSAFASLDAFTPDPDSVYLFGVSSEERSAHSAGWEARAKDVVFARVTGQPQDRVVVDVVGESRAVMLRSRKQLAEFWKQFGRPTGYLDITGLSHHVWAPLLQAAMQVLDRVRVVYVEPLDYTFSPNPTEGAIFDLSESVEGIRPLPGFTVLRDADEDDSCFIPLLGFEGTRFSFLLEQVQPAGDRIYPIVGVPGFRPEFPFHTFLGNKTALQSSAGRLRIHYAIANDPFSAYYALEQIADKFPGSSVKVAPIGTKPHALGAVLFALSRPDTVEIVYDHPIRKDKRSTGRARALVFHVSAFSPRTG